ncbi:MAG: DUF547 domain-containing protein [SAR324 cluster bacterium]|nr:DUF547 domain-containing protein [SAR324 cluster bacterium]
MVGTLCLASFVLAAPNAELWPRWQQHDPESRQTIDHQFWALFLKRYLQTNDPSGIFRVAYQTVTKEDKILLSDYIRELSSLPILEYGLQEQAAYWINLYNALTIQLILDHFPVESILDIDISPGFFSFGPWDAKLISVDGVELSLNDIEHRILRPIWKDNRFHYAINCASLGCPNLAPVPYTSVNLEAALERGARAYINHPRGAFFKDGELSVSKIFNWFEEDFGGDEAGVITHLKKYASGNLADRLQDYRGELNYEYSWKLNAP